jgi:hypothetical protein
MESELNGKNKEILQVTVYMLQDRYMSKILFLSRYLALRKTSSALNSELWWTP